MLAGGLDEIAPAISEMLLSLSTGGASLDVYSFFLSISKVLGCMFKTVIPWKTDKVFTHMVRCHPGKALNYKFKHKRAIKSLSGMDRVAQ